MSNPPAPFTPAGLPKPPAKPSAKSSPKNTPAKTIADFKTIVMRNKDATVTRDGFTHIMYTSPLHAHIEKLLRKEFNVAWSRNRFVQVRKHIMIYLMRIIADGDRMSKETMVVENVAFKYKSVRDPEEMMADGPGLDWWQLKLRENLPNKLEYSYETPITGTPVPSKEDALDAFVTMVEDKIQDWEVEDKEKKQMRKKRDGDEAEAEAKNNPLAELRDEKAMETQIYSLLQNFVPSLPWEDDDIVGTSKLFAQYLDSASHVMWKNVARPVILENVQFLYCERSAQPKEYENGVEVKHHELILFEALPDVGPGEKLILVHGAMRKDKMKALTETLGLMKDTLQKWGKIV